MLSSPQSRPQLVKNVLQKIYLFIKNLRFGTVKNANFVKNRMASGAIIRHVKKDLIISGKRKQKYAR